MKKTKPKTGNGIRYAAIADSLIPPNSSIRGSGCVCKCQKGGKQDGLSRIESSPGWGSNVNGNYEPSTPALPSY